MSGKRVKQIKKLTQKESLNINRKLFKAMIEWSLKDRLKFCWILLMKRDVF